MLTLSPETEARIHAKAVTAGKNPDQAVREAPGEAAGQKTTKASRRKASLAGILAVAERSAARPLPDAHGADEIIGYDEHGIPG